MKAQEDILKRWENIGLLDGLSNDKKIMLANVFEFTLETLSDDNIKRIYNLVNSTKELDIGTALFPILRRIGTYTDINNDDVLLILSEIYSFIEEFKKQMLSHIVDENFDVEAEFCAKYSRMINFNLELFNKMRNEIWFNFSYSLYSELENNLYFENVDQLFGELYTEIENELNLL